MTRTEAHELTDKEIEKLYDDHRAQARGQEVGRDKESPRLAAEYEGWTVLRTWDSSTTTGTNVLADDGIGGIWAICDDNGPWGIVIAEDIEPQEEAR